MRKIFLFFSFAFCFSFSLNGQEFKYDYNSTKGIFQVDGEKWRLPVEVVNKKKRTRWSLFWEFGDGHYAIKQDSSKGFPYVKYLYAESREYPVRLYLTPFNATDLTPPPIKDTLDVFKINKNYRKKYDLKDKKAINIVTNADNEAIPGHEVRVVVHYKNVSQTATDGYLVFLYNNTYNVLEFGFNPLDYLDNSEGLYFKEQKKNPKKIKDLLPQRIKLEKFYYGEMYKGFQAFKSKKLAPDEERRLFLSIRINEDLKEDRDQNKKLKIAALWIPDHGDVQFNDYELTLQKVHDPNKIKVKLPNVIYRKGYPKTFEGVAQFRNTGQATVHKAIIRLDIPNDLNLNTLRIHPERSNPPCSFCDSSQLLSQKPCIEREIKKLPSAKDSSLFATFYGVNLGAREKGKIVFTIQSKDKRPHKTAVGGAVKFEGDEQWYCFTGAKTNWLHKSLQMTVGYNIMHGLNSLEHQTGDFSENFSLRITRQVAPIDSGRGWSHGLSLGYSSYKLRREIDFESQQVPNAFTPYRQTELFQFHNLDLQVFLGWQINNFFRIKGIGGLILPLSAKLKVDGSVNGVQGQFRSDFGFFAKKSSHSYFENNKVDVFPVKVGFQVGLALEVIDIHSVSGGIQYSQQYYPTFSNNKCAILHSLQFYAQFKLMALDGKEDRLYYLRELDLNR